MAKISFPIELWNRHGAVLKSETEKDENSAENSINLPLSEVSKLTLGRSSDCDVCFPKCRYVSNKHCTIELGSCGTAFLTDFSSNGVLITNKKTRRGDTVALNHLDVVYLVKKLGEPESDIHFTFCEDEAVGHDGGTVAYSFGASEARRPSTPLILEEKGGNYQLFGPVDNAKDNAVHLDITLPLDGSGEATEEEGEKEFVPKPTRVRDCMARIQTSVPAEQCSSAAAASESNKVDEDLLLQTLLCSICCEPIHDAVSLSPCNHKFCAGCYSDWMDQSNECPVCRVAVKRICKDHQLNQIVDAYFKTHSDKQRTKEELDELDGRSKILMDTIKPPKSKWTNVDDEFDSESDSGTDVDESDGSSNFCGAARFVCRQCPGGGMGPYGAPVKAIGEICWNVFCHVYWGCRGQRCNGGCLKKLRDNTLTREFLESGLALNGNRFEADVLKDYLNRKGISLDQVRDECVARVSKGDFTVIETSPNSAAVTSNSTLCKKCLNRVWSGLLYQYRANIPKEGLPAEIANRNDCWWGRNCKTQRHKSDHARKLNHICEQTKF